MGSLERRERGRAEARARILDAAREIFTERGYQALTMRNVSEKIEYSAAALYFYFPDKLALVLELVSSDFRMLAAQLQGIRKVPDPIERIRAMGRAYVDFALTHPNHYRLMFMTDLPPVTVHERQSDRGVPERDAYTFLKTMVEEARAVGVFRAEYQDVETVAQLLWAGLHGVAALYIVKAKSEWVELLPARKLAQDMSDVLINGLTIQPGTRP